MLLDRSTNDLCLDANGNLAIASDPYSITQDVASACAVFKGECWYDTTLGITYKETILGYNPPLAYLKAQYVKAALSVPGVATAKVFISSTANREVAGQIQITDQAGIVSTVTLSGPLPPYPQAAVTDDGTFGVTDSGQEITT